jgi:N-acetylmuramoyl-L-alanine amidase
MNRRNFCLSLSAMAMSNWVSAAPQVSTVRVWPAKEYTRLTIESDEALQHSMLFVREPLRLVIDMENMSLNEVLREVAKKIPPDNPVIQNVRVGQYKPNVVRLVLDLKADVKPQVFNLTPVGLYAHRLVLDLYPVAAPDPIAEFLAQLEAKKIQAPTPVQASKPKQKPWIIALDAGHGGEDPGAVGPSGLQEKVVTLSIARHLRDRLETYPQINVLMTRDDDYFVPLATRVQKARAVQADLFISIHADAFTRREAHGSSVYMLSEKGASSAAAKWLANKENQADAIGGLNTQVKDAQLAQVLLDLSQSASKAQSQVLAETVLKQIGRINALHKKQVELANFAVLRAPDIPSILLESAFISNPEEEAKLADDRFRLQIAKSLEAAILGYTKQKQFAARNG